MTLTESELASLGRDELLNAMLSNLEDLSRVSCAFDQYRFRSKPLFGGLFGSGGFSLCSLHEVYGGLDHVWYFVAHDSTRFVIGAAADDRAEAMKQARYSLDLVELVQLQSRMQAFARWREDDRKRRLAEHQAQVEERRRQIQDERGPVVKSMPKRRKRIFDECEGKCHYCATPLTLDGKWHIEHKMPRALGGDNAPTNLVASCVTCNVKKRDTTDQEFKAKLAKGAP